MHFINNALIFRYVEILIDILNIVIYYASKTSFTLNEFGIQTGYNKHQVGNNFGQFVLIVCFITSLVVLGLSLVLESDTKFPLAIAIYNTIISILFMAAGIIILRTWTMYEAYFVSNKETKIKCGLTVGSFCIIQTAVLTAGTIFLAKDNKLNKMFELQQRTPVARNEISEAINEISDAV